MSQVCCRSTIYEPNCVSRIFETMQSKPETSRAQRQSSQVRECFTIICANCKSEIALSEAVTHQVHEQLEADFEKRHAAFQRTLAEREKQLAEQHAHLER